MYSRNILELGEVAEVTVDETLEAEEIEVHAPSSRNLSAMRWGQREERRACMVSCYLASVSIETMSRHLGMDADSILTASASSEAPGSRVQVCKLL